MTRTVHEQGFDTGYDAAIHDTRVEGSRAYAELHEDTSYNGWKNYPTWAVNLWLGNDEGLYREALERTEDQISAQRAFRTKERAKGARLVWTDEESYRYAVADMLKDWVTDELAPDLGASFAADLLGYSLGCVDWEAIADAWIEQVAEQVPA